MNRVLKIVGSILLILLGGYLVWRFAFLIIYILIAAVVSIIGHPLVRLLDRVRYRKFYLPHAFNSMITLLFLLSCFLALFAIFLPLILTEAQAIAQIDINKLGIQLTGPFAWLEGKLHAFELLPATQSLQEFLAEKAKSVVSMTSLTTFLNGLLGFAGSFFIDLFSVLFIAFFFLKDEQMFERMIQLLTPEKHNEAVHTVISDSRNLLVHYFIGVIIEIVGGMALITIAFLVLGVDNALLLGFFGGLMNIIPYLGPIFGTALGLVLGLTGAIASGEYSSITPLTIKIISVLFGVHYLDTMLFQPLIYSKSVKAHPLEIFFTIIIGGSLGGIIGMLLAVPVYTVLRVIAREFFSKFRIVRKLTEEL